MVTPTYFNTLKVLPFDLAQVSAPLRFDAFAVVYICLLLLRLRVRKSGHSPLARYETPLSLILFQAISTMHYRDRGLSSWSILHWKYACTCQL